MEQEDAPRLEGHLAYEAFIPMTWWLMEEAPEAARLRTLNAANEAVLKVLTIIDEVLPENSDEAGATGSDMARLELKINVILDLLGALLSQTLVLPEPTRVGLSAHAARWQPDYWLPEPDAWLGMEVYLSSRYPRPITLVGRVADGPSDGDGYVRIAFEGMSESVRGLLEKFMFRQHRRAVADARRRTSVQGSS